MSFELFSEHGCQVIHHRTPKFPGTGNVVSLKEIIK